MIDIGKWLPVLGLLLVFTLLQLIGPKYLRYDADLVSELQLWRFLSGHWVHANWIHFALNMAGFVLCVMLTGISWSLWQWLARIMILSSTISVCFYIWNSDIGWYVGFSGVLFGLYVLAARATLSKQAMMSSILLVFIALKIVLEQWSSVKITSNELIGVPVLVDAHLYGVLSAVSMIAVLAVFNFLKRV